VTITLRLHGHAINSMEWVGYDLTKNGLARLDLSQSRTVSIGWTRSDLISVSVSMPQILVGPHLLPYI
jgi:hypothetical protein